MRKGSNGFGVAAAILVAAIAIVLMSTGAEAAYRHEKTSEVEIPREGAVRLFVRTMIADVVITGSTEATDISLRIAKKVEAEDEEKARELAEEIKVRIDNDGEEILVHTEIPESRRKDVSIFNFVFRRQMKIDLVLELVVPAGLVVELETASGDVRADNLADRLEATSASGDLEIARIGGDVELETASGDIVLSDAGGDVRIGTASGDIGVHGVGGDLSVSSATGDIDLEEITGDLSLSTLSGDVTVDGVRGVSFTSMNGDARFSRVRGEVHAKAASGDIALDLAPEEDVEYAVRTSSGNIEFIFRAIMSGGFILKAETTTGDINASLPINVTKVGRNRILGVVREGKGKIVLETASGDISISEPEE